MPETSKLALMIALCCWLGTTSGCQSKPCIDSSAYGNLAQPGDTFSMFRAAIDLKCDREAYALFSRRIRTEILSFSEFVVGLEHDKAGPFIAELHEARYVRNVYVGPPRTKAVMTLQSSKRTVDVDMIYEDGGWRIDWDPRP